MATSPDSAPRAYRDGERRLVAGVAAGLAEHLGWPITTVRVGFVLLALASGLGLALYAAFWLLLPLRQSDQPPNDRGEPGLLPILSLGALLLGGAILLSAVVPALDVTNVQLLVALAIAGTGVALIWRQADEEQRASAGSGDTSRWWRIGGGSALILTGVVLLISDAADPVQAIRGLLVGLIVAAGIGVLALPWIRRQWETANTERAERIRAAERAEVAAQVHDSVLQTLTLIRTNAADEDAVTRLARAEERRLRTWLYEPSGDPTETLRPALDALAAATEAAHPVTVEVVAVGDCALDPALRAALAAASEALRNAAKHAGGTITLFAEVEDACVSISVRDRGPGFDFTAVPADRLGIRESIVGRMQRNGGTAEVRTSDGGTDVRLTVPREGA